MKKALMYFLSVFYLCNSAFCQSSGIQSTRTIELPKNIAWSQLIAGKNKCFVMGFEKTKAYLLDTRNNSRVAFSDIKRGKFLILSREKAYFAPLGSVADNGPDENKISVYDLNGKYKGEKRVLYNGYNLRYFLTEKPDAFACLAIDLDKYMSGKTNGNMEGGIFIEGNSHPLIRFTYPQAPPPTQIVFPVAAIRNKIYLAFENKYNIDVYSKDGKKIGNISNPGFKMEPYSKNEIELLQPMKRTTIKEGITCPPVIKCLDISKKGMVYVTRHPRPGAGKLFIDAFNELGSLAGTFQIKLEKGETVVDVCMMEKEYCILLHSEKANLYYVKGYTLN
ncbi:MAG TPA: hypothetical protein VHO03_18620 [Ignavibacteriales bacterium]|nr:hypothetical protein [Ignavibacteriales bacterium]